MDVSDAWHRRAALSATVSNTGWISVDELPMTRRISLVAFSRSSASARCFSRSRTVEPFLSRGLRAAEGLASTLAFVGFASRRIGISLPVTAATGAGNAQTEADEFPEGSESARRLGFRAILCIPLIREGVTIGAISLRDTKVRLFTDRQVALLQTFADQAVIAIENVRLFNETKEALAQQTATGEILRVISSSPTDVQPVFDVLVARAVRLCGARFGRVYS